MVQKIKHTKTLEHVRKPHRQVHNKDPQENVQRKQRMHSNTCQSKKQTKKKNTSCDAKLEMKEGTGNEKTTKANRCLKSQQHHRGHGIKTHFGPLKHDIRLQSKYLFFFTRLKQ